MPRNFYSEEGTNNSKEISDLLLDHECIGVAAVLVLVLASGFQAKPVRDVHLAALRAHVLSVGWEWCV